MIAADFEGFAFVVPDMWECQVTGSKLWGWREKVLISLFSLGEEEPGECVCFFPSSPGRLRAY